uniref:Elongation of very long chain fatty acids protein n=1 Tax=Meloidogyne floridensis TaxID=298350 RepID=A0A915P2T7_9BILA
MRDRQPFQLRVPLIVWNFVLAIFSFAGLVRFSEFLHYYHHAAVFVYTIHSGTEHTAPGQAFISMNFLAHSAMYSYYTAKSCGIKVPRIIAMAVTSIQTAQMFLGVAVSTLVLKLKLLDGYRCQQSWANLILAFAIYASFALLFVRFFVDAYLHRNRKRKEK